MEQKTINRGVLLIMALFFLQPLVLGGWLALIPYVKETLGLSKAEFAVALLGMPLALVVSLQFAGKAVSGFGVRKLFILAFPVQCVASVLPLLAGSQMSLFFALAGFGFAAAFMEVALNVYAGRIEKKAAALIMNRCHGFWALGLMVGSAIATWTAGFSEPFHVQLAIALVSTAFGIFVARQLPKVGETEAAKGLARRRFSDLPPALLPIGAFMLTITLTEGAMADWSAIYLSERLASDLTDAGIAVSIFSAFLAAGRFSGDYLKRRFGALALARGSVVMALVGILFLILPLPLVFAFIGFACVGLGVASGYPLGVSAVAALDDTHEASNVALMSTCALAGFLIGPPLIGFLSEAFGMRIGFAALIPGLLACAWLAAWLMPRQSQQIGE